MSAHRMTQRVMLASAVMAIVLAACNSASNAEGPPSTTTPGGSTSPHRSGPITKGNDDWTTYHYAQNRRGYDPHIPTASGTLSSAWTAKLDGAVYAEPLVIGTTIIAVTENDTIYALSLSGGV